LSGYTAFARRPKSKMQAPDTSAMSIHFVRYARFANSSAAAPAEASSPYSEPPARQMALTAVRCSPLIPGEPPRTSMCIEATFGK
jgi:hypothetical protein